MRVVPAYSIPFKSLAVGAVASGICMEKRASPVVCITTGIVATFATAFFLHLQKTKSNFSDNITKLMDLNRLCFLAKFRPESILGRISVPKVKLNISQSYQNLSSFYFLRAFGCISKEESRIFNQIKTNDGCFFDKIGQNKLVRSDSCYVEDPGRIEMSLKKQLSYAEAHRTNQKEIPFTLQKAPNIWTGIGIEFAQPKRSEGYLRAKEGIKFPFAWFSVQGMRPCQEDRCVCHSFQLMDGGGKVHNFMLTGVFDGHGGSGAASFMSHHLTQRLKHSFQELLSENVELSDLNIWNLLKQVCVQMSEDLNKSNAKDSGTTASFSLLKDGEDLWTANVGDSRTFIASSKGKVIQLSEDASFSGNPMLSKEGYDQIFKEKKPTGNCFEKRVWRGGGFIWNDRLNGVLSMARAIGNRYLGEAISARPKITKISLSKTFEPDDTPYLFHHTDGLKIATNQTAKAVKFKNPIEIVTNLVYSAAGQYAGDNITVMVAKLKTE